MKVEYMKVKNGRVNRNMLFKVIYNINWRHSVVSETYIQKTLKQPQDKKQRRIANETIARIKSKQKYSKEGR